MSCCNAVIAVPFLGANWYISYSIFKKEKKEYSGKSGYVFIFILNSEKNENEILTFFCSYLHLCQGIICSRVINHYSVAPLLEMEFQKMLNLPTHSIYIKPLFAVLSLFKRPKKNDLIMLIPPDFQLNLNWIGLSLKPWYIIHSPIHV